MGGQIATKRPIKFPLLQCRYLLNFGDYDLALRLCKYRKRQIPKRVFADPSSSVSAIYPSACNWTVKDRNEFLETNRLIFRQYAVKIPDWGNSQTSVDRCVNSPGISWSPARIHKYFGPGQFKKQIGGPSLAAEGFPGYLTNFDFSWIHKHMVQKSRAPSNQGPPFFTSTEIIEMICPLVLPRDDAIAN